LEQERLLWSAKLEQENKDRRISVKTLQVQIESMSKSHETAQQKRVDIDSAAFAQTLTPDQCFELVKGWAPGGAHRIKERLGSNAYAIVQECTERRKN
jgi:hypothetical protein